MGWSVVEEKGNNLVTSLSGGNIRFGNGVGSKARISISIYEASRYDEYFDVPIDATIYRVAFVQFEEMNKGGDIVATNYSPSFRGDNTSSISFSLNRVGGYLQYQLQKYTPEPPSTPLSITVPSDIKVGDDFNISWGTGSGATRYHLERSVNGGTYTQIYQGSNRNYTDTALETWDTVSYRVRAYNSDGYSSYRTSTICNVSKKLDITAKIYGGGYP